MILCLSAFTFSKKKNPQKNPTNKIGHLLKYLIIGGGGENTTYMQCIHIDIQKSPKQTTANNHKFVRDKSTPD